MYEKIEAELRGVQQALHSSRVVSTAPPPSEETELGDEPTQLHRLADATEAPSSCTGRNRTGHSGPEASTRGSNRATQGCTVGEGFPPSKV
jgi:hypothetical protein